MADLPPVRFIDKRRPLDPNAPPPDLTGAPATAPADLTGDGRFVSECGHCGNVTRVKNLTERQSQEPCDRCAVRLDDDEPPTVAYEAGWCGCGSPDLVDELMLRYLSSLPAWEKREHGLTDGEYLLLAYIADDLGWTEHGTGIYGAWLTDGGREALANLQARAEQ